MSPGIRFPLAVGLASLLGAYASGTVGGYWGGIVGLLSGALGVGAAIMVASTSYAEGVEDGRAMMEDE